MPAHGRWGQSHDDEILEFNVRAKLGIPAKACPKHVTDALTQKYDADMLSFLQRRAKANLAKCN
jgi:hypothetical protein